MNNGFTIKKASDGRFFMLAHAELKHNRRYISDKGMLRQAQHDSEKKNAQIMRNGVYKYAQTARTLVAWTNARLVRLGTDLYPKKSLRNFFGTPFI